MTEILTRYDYKSSGSCHCDGYQTDKYDMGNYQLRIRVKKETFKIKKNGNSVTQWLPITMLEETLKTHHDVAIPA